MLRILAAPVVVAPVSAGSVAGIAAWRVSRTLASNAVVSGTGGPSPSIRALDGGFPMMLVADVVGGVQVCVDHAIQNSSSGLDLPAGRSVITGRSPADLLRAQRPLTAHRTIDQERGPSDAV